MRIAEKRKVRSQHCMSSVPAFRQMSEVVWRMALYRNGTSAMEYEQSKGCAGGAGQNQGMVKAVYWRGLLLF